MYYAFARKRPRARELMVSSWVRLFSRRVRPLCFALKWFRPGFRAISLPFLVTLIRFVYDLFVFINKLILNFSHFQFWFSWDSLKGCAVSFWAFLYFVGYFILCRDNFQEPFKSFLEKTFLHVLVAPHKKRSIFTLCPSASHSAARFAFRLRSCSPVPIFTWTPFVSVTCDFAFTSFAFCSIRTDIYHNPLFSQQGLRCWGYLNEVKIRFSGNRNRLRCREYTKVFATYTNNTKFFRPYWLVYTYVIFFQGYKNYIKKRA